MRLDCFKGALEILIQVLCLKRPQECRKLSFGFGWQIERRHQDADQIVLCRRRPVRCLQAMQLRELGWIEWQQWFRLQPQRSRQSGRRRFGQLVDTRRRHERFVWLVRIDGRQRWWLGQ